MMIKKIKYFFFFFFGWGGGGGGGCCGGMFLLGFLFMGVLLCMPLLFHQAIGLTLRPSCGAKKGCLVPCRVSSKGLTSFNNRTGGAGREESLCWGYGEKENDCSGTVNHIMKMYSNILQVGFEGVKRCSLQAVPSRRWSVPLCQNCGHLEDIVHIGSFSLGLFAFCMYLHFNCKTAHRHCSASPEHLQVELEGHSTSSPPP